MARADAARIARAEAIVIRRSWRTELKNATAEKDVLAIVQGFLAEWKRAEIESLPGGAWPQRIATRADLLAHANVLAASHARFEGDASALAGLQEMLLFFTHAAVRIARLAAVREIADRPGDGPPARPRRSVVGRMRPRGRRRIPKPALRPIPRPRG